MKKFTILAPLTISTFDGRTAQLAPEDATALFRELKSAKIISIEGEAHDLTTAIIEEGEGDYTVELQSVAGDKKTSISLKQFTDLLWQRNNHHLRATHGGIVWDISSLSTLAPETDPENVVTEEPKEPTEEELERIRRNEEIEKEVADRLKSSSESTPAPQKKTSSGKSSGDKKSK